MMTYRLRVATMADIPHFVKHREQMFRDMGIPADFDAMAAAATTWLATAIPDGRYRGWVATAPDGAVVAGRPLLRGVNERWRERAHEIGRGERDQESPSATIDVDPIESGDRSLEIDGHLFAGAEG